MKPLAILLLFIFSTAAIAADFKAKNYDLNTVETGSISIAGRLQTWTFTKVCIDGQVYVLIDGVTGPNGITVSFVNGQPETCKTSPVK